MAETMAVNLASRRALEAAGEPHVRLNSRPAKSPDARQSRI